MDVHELIRVFLKEENRKELSLYAYMLMGNKNDALDLLSDLLIEIYENPNSACPGPAVWNRAKAI